MWFRQADLGDLSSSLVASVLHTCVSPVWSPSRVTQCGSLWGRWDYLAWYEGDRVLCWARSRRPSMLPPALRAGGTAEQMGIPGSFPSSFSETLSQLKLTRLPIFSFPPFPPCCFCLLAALKCHVNEQDRESFKERCSPKVQDFSSCQAKLFGLLFLLNFYK